MNILIVIPRPLLLVGNKENYNYTFPLGLGYISSVLKRAGHTVDCLNLNHYGKTTPELIAGMMSKTNYDFVLTGGQSTLYKAVKSITDAARATSKAKVLLGGPLVSSDPELMLNALNPDFIAVGEGEKTALELIDCVRDNGDLKAVPGLLFKDTDGKPFFTAQRGPIMDLDSLPVPDLEGFEYSKYLEHIRPNDWLDYYLYDNPRVYPIICTRSCPYLCTFCYHPLGNRYRERSVDNIMKELEENVPKYKINIIMIYDELFVDKKERVKEFCERMKKLRSSISWDCRWHCLGRVDTISEEVVAMMKDAGCYYIGYGFESINPGILKSMKKHITPEQIDKALHMTLKYDIALHGMFIFGDPEETVETAYETLNYWKEHYYAHCVLDFIRPYPGCALYKYSIEKGLIKDRLDYIANHILGDFINMTKNISDRQFDQLKLDVFVAELKYWMYANPKKMKKTSDKIYEITVQCPHCKKEVTYGNYFVNQRLFYIFQIYCRICHKRFNIVSLSYLAIARAMVWFFESKLFTRNFKMFAYNFERRIRRPILRGLLMGRTE